MFGIHPEDLDSTDIPICHNLYSISQTDRVRQLTFDRDLLLDLIEFTRASGHGYGITNILDHFLDHKGIKQPTTSTI